MYTPSSRPVDRPHHRVVKSELPVIHCEYIVQKVGFYPLHRVILLYTKWTTKSEIVSKLNTRLLFFANFLEIYRMVHSL